MVNFCVVCLVAMPAIKANCADCRLGEVRQWASTEEDHKREKKRLLGAASTLHQLAKVAQDAVGLLYFSLPGFSGQGNLIKPHVDVAQHHKHTTHATHAHDAAGRVHM